MRDGFAWLAHASGKGLAMIISQPAWLCIEATWQRMLGHIASEEPAREPMRETTHTTPRAMAAAPVEAEAVAPAPAAITGAAETAAPASPRALPPDVHAPLTATERRARAAALRGLAFSRGRRFDAARTAFIEASRLDPALDLTRTPAFWKLERAAHEAAIEAYVETGRDGDAAILRARVHSTFRPKALRPRTGPVLSS